MSRRASPRTDAGAGPTRWVPLALALATAACGAPTPPPRHPAPAPAAVAHPDAGTAHGGHHEARAPLPPGRPPTPVERRAINRLFRSAERVRGLTFRHPVTVEVQDQAGIVARLQADMDDDDLVRARALYAALGLLPPDIDMRGLLTRVLGEQVIGYYDPKTATLVVRDDVIRALQQGGGDQALDEARITLVHEMVHALQDQRLGLGAMYDAKRDSDPDNAFRGLVEGDATLAMIAYLAHQAGGTLDTFTHTPGLMRQLAGRVDALPGGQLGAAPAIVRVTLVSSYIEGMLFCAALQARGGWPAVDAAYRVLPESTEQVLHPRKYIRGEQPDTVRIPTLPALTAAGLSKLDEDTLGELEMSVYFAQGTGHDTDPEAAAGWGGDRVRVYKDTTGHTSAVWFTSWDDDHEAGEARAAAERVMDAVPEARRARFAVVRDGRAVLMVRDLAPALLPPVTAAFHRFAHGLPPAHTP